MRSREPSRRAYLASVAVVGGMLLVAVTLLIAGVERRFLTRPVAAVPPRARVEQAPPPAEKLAATLEQRFQTDRHEPPATLLRTESAFRGAFAGAQGVSLQRIECRGHTCRAEVTFASEARDAEFTRRIFVDPETMIDLDHVGVVIPTRVTSDDGSVKATVYFVGPDA